MTKQAPRWAAFWTLDQVAETTDVSAATGRELWAFVEDDHRHPEQDFDPATWTEGSPNRLDRSWGKLTEEARADVLDTVGALLA